MNKLYTIGHSTLPIERFIELLHNHNVQVIADVRSSPFSRYCPWFSQAPLANALASADIKYVFLGEELGARRAESSCYIGTRADYSRIANLQSFQNGIDRLKAGVSKYNVSLLCSEKEPLDCHRTILVARYLKGYCGINHINHDGSCEAHEDLELRLLRMFGLDFPDLFSNNQSVLDEAYNRRGEEINYVKNHQSAL